MTTNYQPSSPASRADRTPSASRHDVLLPGQAAAPAGPCDLRGMYLMHHAFRRDLRDFATAAARTPAEDRDRWTALAARWERFAHLLHEHHSVEDRVLWPLLQQAVESEGDARGRRVLKDMEAEHQLIDPLLARCGDLFGRLRTNAEAEAVTDLQSVLEQTRTVLDQHLGHEERDAVALVQRHVSASDWDRLERTEFRGRPNPRQLRFQLPWMVHEVPLEVSSAVVADAGPLFALVLRLSRRSFLRQQQEAFGPV